MDHDVPLGDYAHYTTRLVRDGFVYIFDEARRRLSGYYATPTGHFTRFDISRPLPPALKEGAPCSRNGHPEVAGCITISSPKQASAIWIGYSEVQWTPAVLAKHEDAGYRERHMRKFDVKAWLASQNASHAEKIACVAECVAEYSPEVEQRRFGFSPAKFHSRSDQAAGLNQASDALLDGMGVVLALDDPSGITQDLAQLMQTGVHSFVNRPEYKRKLQVSSAIEQMRQGIRTQAELSAIAKAHRQARQAVSPGYGGAGFGGGAANAGMALARMFNDKLDEDLTNLEERLRNLTPQQLDQAGDEAWEEYAEKYDETARARWQASFDKKMKAFDRIFTGPLAQAHATWLASQSLTSQFECNFDPNDPHSGTAYAVAFALCVEGTQDKKASFDAVFKQLEGDPEDPANLAVRALLLNQQGLAQKAANVDAATLDPRSIPWDALIGAYEEVQAVAGTAAQTATAQLLMQLGAPLMKLLDKGIDGGVRPALIAFGMAGQAPIVKVSVTGGKKAFRAAIIRQLLGLHGGRIDRNAMQRAVSAELRRLQMRGVPMHGTARKTFLVLADPAVVKSMPSGLSARQRATWVAGSLRTVEQYEATEMTRWKTTVTPKVRLGAAAVIVQTLCFSKVAADKDGVMDHERFDSITRYWASLGAVAGTASETLGTLVKNAATSGSLRYAPTAMKSLGALMAKWGGRANVAGGVVMAAMDFWQGVKAYQENQPGMMVLYFSSALLGIGAIFAFGVSLLLGVVVLALLLIVVVLIEHFKDNKLQDWLERCYSWGRLQDYPTAEQERRELKLALAG
ncbi:hypothetical protein N799_12900 [Lysobacter arseniciresistens ZS79]|uniref:Toxin VasX N-terminal region domain-containing protein n=2 Tax=Novilysobacter TaxID=3382699 RepID=A0A0A0ER75_9GAMM|nr:hypothetical protein N799_12900 [Lysobacter arseniciresistens ZS79]